LAQVLEVKYKFIESVEDCRKGGTSPHMPGSNRETCAKCGGVIFKNWNDDEGFEILIDQIYSLKLSRLIEDAVIGKHSFALANQKRNEST
jgi:hypothetical protein